MRLIDWWAVGDAADREEVIEGLEGTSFLRT